MARHWTPSERARQAELIRRRRPWERSTGPKTREGKAKTSCNAYKGSTWRLLRQLSCAMRQQREVLRKVRES
jgi:hypothetical protein